jgi:hypothetical protein
MKHSKINLIHQELSQLLPWYVNRTLQGFELKAVEDHLSVCLTCKRELKQLEKLAQIVSQEDLLDTAESAAFSRLKKRLHSGTQAAKALELPVMPQQDQPVKQKRAVDKDTRLNTTKKQGWMIAALPRSALAMAAALILSLLMPRLVGIDLKHHNSFRTLSSNKGQKVNNAKEIRVVFAETTNQQQRNDIIARINGQIIGKPTGQGVYNVQLNSSVNTKHLLEVIESLRKDSNVIFAEPAYALLSSATEGK